MVNLVAAAIAQCILQQATMTKYSEVLQSIDTCRKSTRSC